MTLSLITVQGTHLSHTSKSFIKLCCTAWNTSSHLLPSYPSNFSSMKSFLICPGRIDHSVSLCIVDRLHPWCFHHFISLNSCVSFLPNSAQITLSLVLGLLVALASATRPGSLHMPTSDTDVSFPSRCPGIRDALQMTPSISHREQDFKTRSLQS